MSRYQYRVTVDNHTVESSSPYLSETQELSVTDGPCDETLARRICKLLKMSFVRLSVTDGKTQITARCSQDTSCFFWAGGAAIK